MGCSNKWWVVDSATSTGFEPPDNPGLLEWLMPDTGEDPLEILIRAEEEAEQECYQ